MEISEQRKIYKELLDHLEVWQEICHIGDLKRKQSELAHVKQSIREIVYSQNFREALKTSMGN
jgi:hypothetical protein